MTTEERAELDALLLRMLLAQRENNAAREAYEAAHRRVFAKEYRARRKARLQAEEQERSA